MQFKAGYIVDSIAKVISEYKVNLNPNSNTEQAQLHQINGLLQHVSSFDVEFPNPHVLEFDQLNPVLATLNNVITRGLPTRAPIFIEALFAEIGLTHKIDSESIIDFSELLGEINFEEIFQLLHIIEPGLEINRSNYGGNPGSNLEWEFIEKHPFLKQILESQRDFSKINPRLQGNRTVDFCFTSPYLHWNENKKCIVRKGRIFEVDGPHHSLAEYKYYDAYRDAIAEEEDFQTIRRTVDEINQDNTDFEELIGRKVYQNFKKNFELDIKENLKQYSLIFIPFAVARVQKTIIEFLLVHPELFKKVKIEIAIIERDLPCGAIAIEILNEMIQNINSILKNEDVLHLPDIEITVFENPKWNLNPKLHLKASIKDEQYFEANKNKFDVIIDHSILRRSNVYKESDYESEKAIKIRSSHYYDTSFGNERRIYCSKLLEYKNLVTKNLDGSYKSIQEVEPFINYFIQNIFRKVSFREGQLPIISRALQQLPVIGLLPTGGGKSLTYQLPALLQPGLCVVVDPIKSLMEDQVRVLKENWIDCCQFINSNLTREEKAKKLIDFRYGETMFLFVSPERFVMEDFRKIVSTIDMSIFKLAFSFCVIDEVHCVSEWGHDFRSTYLMLGKNAQIYTKTRSGNPVSLIGLTATASFDVLADIERELQINHVDIAAAIIMIENTIRPELFYRVIDVTNKNRIEALNQDFLNIGNNLAKINKESVLLASQNHHFEEFDKKDFVSEETKDIEDQSKLKFEYNPDYLIKDELSNQSNNNFCSIIFCPTRGDNRNDAGLLTDSRGVPFVYENLATHTDKKGFFYAADSDFLKAQIQNHFRNYTTGKIPHMVCTKAFGMGIDKNNIRTTYHYYYSSSLESLVQETGRSGRDKKISEANILVSTKSYAKIDIYKFFDTFITNPILKNIFTRKAIRQLFERKWNDETRKFENITFDSIKEIVSKINSTDFSLVNAQGNRYNNLSTETIQNLKSLLLEKDADNYKFIINDFEDRDIHNFFHDSTFRGLDAEKNQILDLFKEKEFYYDGNLKRNFDGQDSLVAEFNKCNSDQFSFIFTAKKIYKDASNDVCTILGVIPNEVPRYQNSSNIGIIKNLLNFSSCFTDFILTLEEKNVIDFSSLSDQDLYKIKYIYSRERNSSNDTGRLIYRMHSMGFLENYQIDFNQNNLYKCAFRKYSTIDFYVKNIDAYLRRYLSETSVIENIINLNNRLDKSTLIENIIECIYFLSEFSYSEVVSKRKRATNEIENVMNQAITKADFVGIDKWFEQNKFIKEQIYFYFNAKYARLDYKIHIDQESKDYSLLNDYKDNRENKVNAYNKFEILNKYVDVYQLDSGPEQNNYKHMIGSCKKILRSLVESDLNKDWILRLIKAFAMYSVNNDSYISEANDDLELGFKNLYLDTNYHNDNYLFIEQIIVSYFDKLEINIGRDNLSFNDIRLIHVKVLLEMQENKITELIIKNNLVNN